MSAVSAEVRPPWRVRRRAEGGRAPPPPDHLTAQARRPSSVGPKAQSPSGSLELRRLLRATLAPQAPEAPPTVPELGRVGTISEHRARFARNELVHAAGELLADIRVRRRHESRLSLVDRPHDFTRIWER